jgi:hypothetical protein
LYVERTHKTATSTTRSLGFSPSRMSLAVARGGGFSTSRSTAGRCGPADFGWGEGCAGGSAGMGESAWPMPAPARTTPTIRQAVGVLGRVQSCPVLRGGLEPRDQFDWLAGLEAAGLAVEDGEFRVADDLLARLGPDEGGEHPGLPLAQRPRPRGASLPVSGDSRVIRQPGSLAEIGRHLT